MKKRVLALLLTATMILGLTACGGKDTPAADGGADSSQTTTESGTFRSGRT